MKLKTIKNCLTKRAGYIFEEFLHPNKIVVKNQILLTCCHPEGINDVTSIIFDHHHSR